MKLEFQILVLFLLSVLLLAVNQLAPRTQRVDFDTPNWTCLASTDGGESSAVLGVTDRGAELRLNIKGSAADPFAAALFHFAGDDPCLNLEWVSNVRVTAFIEGADREYFRLQFRNRIEGIHSDADPVSRQYNEVSFELTSQPRTVVFAKEHFHVPSWWAEEYGNTFADSIPSFGQVDAVELATGSSVRQANLNLVIEKIELQGNWISPILLYQALLGSWLLFSLIVAIRKLLEVRNALHQAQEREDRLRVVNDSLKTHASSLSKLACHDPLTGLLNRRGLSDFIRNFLAAMDTSTPVSVVAFDIDHFKSINDSRGHSFGDKVLTELGRYLQKQNCENITLSRWGGEEFVALCIGYTEDAAWIMAEKMRCEIESTAGVTCSFGISRVHYQENFQDALDRADKAMYRSKSLGRNRVTRFSDIETSAPSSTQEPQQQACLPTP